MTSTIELPGYERIEKTYGGETKAVYVAGDGPAVLVCTEIPGITPSVMAFGQRLVELGFGVALPDLFGTPGAAPTNGRLVRQVARACISSEFETFRTGRTSPVTEWLRSLGRDLHAECGGPGIGVIGMCLTGGFALGMMADDHVLAPVLSQPSMPFALSTKHRADLGISAADTEAAVASGCPVLGMRFTGDKLSPPERFETLRRTFGQNFVGIEIDSSKGNPHGLPADAHSVVTEHFVDEPGHPTREAWDTMVEFFRSRLLDHDAG